VGDYSECRKHAQDHWPMATAGILDERGARATTFQWPP
jgi:hypothetical protein